MGVPLSVPRSNGARRFLRPVLVVLASLAVITCAEDPVGPAISEGRLKVVPVFQSNARLAPLAIDRVRVLVTRPPLVEEPPEIVVDDTFAFNLNSNQLTIRDIHVPMQEATEDVVVSLEMLAGTVLLFEGSQNVTLVRGRSTSPTNIPMLYQGPGANVASLTITPRDTTLAPGATFTFGLEAFDNQGAPVPQYYASWSLTGGPATGARINAVGQLTAPAVRDTFYVKAISLPTGSTDSTRVIIGPPVTPPPVQVIPNPISAGAEHTCEIRTTATYCWGANIDGQLGDGTATNRLVPTPVSGGQTFVAISAGTSHTCALNAQGQAFCWGHNSNGELGDGSTTDRNTPTAVAGGLTFAQISAAQEFTCAVTLTGEGRCWGVNFSGQLGDGTTNNRTTPTLVSGGHNFVRITSAAEFDISSDHSCAIDAAGAAWCWGDNSQGQLGTGDQNGSQIPVAVTGGQVFSEISAGGRSTCAIATSGAGFCWGLNFGVPLTSPTPVAGGFSYSALDMGDTHVCAKATAGWVCGGNGTEGQLGDGSGQDQVTPVAPAGGRTYTFVAAGGRHSCGITATGTFCWGSNSSGQIGNGDGEQSFNNTPVAVMGAPASISISAGNNQSVPVNTEVPIPPEARVLDINGQPVMGAEVTFTVTAGGGDLNNGGGPTYTFLTNAAGVLSVVWTVGPNPGGNTLTARVGAAGVTGNPVSFTATGTTGAVNLRTWQGGTSTAWDVAANWIPAIVPTITDSVVIGNGTNQPQLTANQVVGAVSIVAGGRLTINGQGLAVARGLSTGGTGVLVMTNGADVVTVGGNAFFDGGNELNLMSAGGLSIGGNLTQRATNSGDSFHPSGTHITLLAGTAPVIDFATPGVVPGSSHFQELAWSGGGTMTLLTQAMAHGNLTITGQTAATISSANGSRLTVGNLFTAAGLTFNNVPLTISQTVSGVLALSNISFTAMPTNVAQLVITHPGDASPFSFTNLQFSTVPVAPNGFYLDATDNDGATNGVLTINMAGAAPASGGAFVRTTGGAVVNWPAGTTRAWTGATSTDWNTGSNWNPAGVPAALDDVTIGGATNQPTLSADGTAHSIVVSTAGARLTLGGRTLDVATSFTVHTDGVLVMNNVNDVLIVRGDAAFQGGNETGLLTAGQLRLFGGFNVGQQTTALAFVASGSHKTVMLGSALQTVTICCTANSSGFQNLDLSQSAGINIQFSGNGVPVFDTLISKPGAGPTPLLYMLGSPLTARRFNIDRLTVDRGTLTLNEQGVVANQQFDNVTFQNYQTTQTQLAITAAGGSPSRTLTFNNLAFMPLSAGNTGRYLNVTASAQTLVVDLLGASPAANGPTFTTINGNATVNWPAASSTWTGAASTDWNTAANWSSAAVPGVSSNVVIPSGTPNSPLLSTTGSINSLLVSAGAVLNLSGNLTVAGNVDVGGTVPGTGTITMTGTANLRGAVPNLIITNPVTLNGNTTLSGGTATISGAAANLTLNGFGFIAGTLVTQTGGVVTMTNPADSMVVSLDATFSGGSTLGRLTAGVIELRGNLTQNPTSSQNSFTATGTRVRAIGAGSVAYTLNSSSATLSRFSALLINKTGGFVALGNVITVSDSMIVGASNSVTVGGTLLPRLLRMGTSSSVAGGGTLQMTADSLFVGGGASLAVTTVDFNGTAPQLIPAITYQNLLLSGPTSYSVTGTTTVVGSTTVSGNGASLVLAGRRLNTNLFTTTGTGLLVMTNPLDSLMVTGNAVFNGGAEGGSNLIDGTLSIGGNLSHASNQFRALGNHQTIFTNAAAQVISGGIEPIFNDLVVAGSLTLTTNILMSRDLIMRTGGTSLVSQTTQTVRGTRNVTLAAGSTVTPTLLEVFGTITSAGLLSPANITFSGTGTIPASSANIVYQRIVVSNVSTGYTAGGTINAPNGMSVAGSFAVGPATVTVNDFSTSTPTGLLVMSNPAGALDIATIASFDGGDETGLLTAGTILVRGSMTQSATNSANSFRATGTHTVQFIGTGASQFAFASAGSQFQNLAIAMSSGSATVTGGSIVVAGNLSVNQGPFILNGHRVDVLGNFSINGANSTIRMLNDADSLIVTGTALFAGASTSGLLTNGVLRLQGNFSQNATVSTLSFAPSGTHKTVLGSGIGHTVSMGSPGLGAAGSHFQVLDVTPAIGGVTLDVNMQADSLIATATGAQILSSGSTLTVRRAQVTGLTLNNTRLALDEQGVAAAESLTNVSFLGFAGIGDIMLQVLAPGNNFAARPTISVSNMNFQSMPIGAGNFYVDLTSTNDQAVTLTMTGSNQRTAVGGNGPTLTRVTGLGANVNWP